MHFCKIKMKTGEEWLINIEQISAAKKKDDGCVLTMTNRDEIHLRVNIIPELAKFIQASAVPGARALNIIVEE